jgi:hypothetical protein
MSITKGITNEKFHRYFSESSRTVHFLIALLITVLYRQNHQQIKACNFFLRTFSVSKSIRNNIFLLPTDLPTDKKLPTKDSSIEHFRR